MDDARGLCTFRLLASEAPIMRETEDAILTLFSTLGSPKEVELYLKNYARADDEKRFAVIKVGGAVIERDLNALASSLALLKKVGLVPVVVHGARPQLDRALREMGIESRFVDDLRVTTPEVLDVARKVFVRETMRLVDALEAHGARARPLTTGIFEAVQMSPELGMVGDIIEIDDDPIKAAIQARVIPVVAPLGETPEGQILNLSADYAALDLARELQPRKVILLTTTGGLLDSEGTILPAVNLAEDFESLSGGDELDVTGKKKLAALKELLDALPPSSSVSITSPEHLVKELFTHKGAGTLVKQGERVRVIESFDDVDRPRLKALLESCFGRALDPNYFERKRPYRIYLAESFRAVAILTHEGQLGQQGVPYLDKFAVTTEAQGAGVGGSIWTKLLRDNPKLYWRARRANPINAWYFEQADGAYKTDEWVVFWDGLVEYDEIKTAVEDALSLPPTMIAHAEANT
jgi:acetylglutamate kinase